MNAIKTPEVIDQDRRRLLGTAAVGRGFGPKRAGELRTLLRAVIASEFMPKAPVANR
jgi:hypothetical protein